MNNLPEFKIIVIDDNPDIHRDFIKILTSSTTTELDKLSMQLFGKKNEDLLLPQFEIDTATQGQEGVARIKKALEIGQPYALAFVDIRMPPGWDGIETIKHIWQLDRDIQIVICTAYSDYSWEETISHLGKTDNLLILKKPFDNVAVRQLACALTKKWQLLQDARKYTYNLEQEVEDRTISLQKSLSLVKATLESSNDGILVIDDAGNIVDYNHKLVDLLEIPQSILDSKSEKAILNYLRDKLLNPDDVLIKLQDLSIPNDTIKLEIIKFTDGRIFECYSQPQKLNGKIVGRVLNFHDITKRARLEQELQHQATHDALTGLPNRVMLLEKIKQAVKLAEQNKNQFALLFLDLDRFKLINDSLSHAFGDEILQTTATRLQSIVQPEDTVARLGGDEFVVLLSNINNNDEVITKSKKILDTFRKPFSISNRQISVTASIGISMYPKDGTGIDMLLKNADSAMYQAKETGANTFQFYTAEMNAYTLARLDEEMQLRNAIFNNEFVLTYQPQIDLATEKLIAVEALIRWNHPEKGEILPMDFIPLAEETGLIVPIGEWVMRTACKENKAWQDQGLPPIRVAVNVTAQQLKQQNLVAMVKDILDETKLDPKYLEIELTENVIISSREVVRVVTELKKLGVTLAIDDFGTGYSSLTYLKKIPLDRLKIDSSFIQNLQSGSNDNVLVRAMIAMAKNLNLEVLAEGVETEKQLKFLKSQECGEIQGYYFSKPLPPKDFQHLLKDYAARKKVAKIT